MSLSDKAQEDFVSEKAKSSSSNLPEIEKTVTVDTVHNDEAIKVLANYAGDEVWTDEEERKLLRRIDWKLMPILCVTYSLQYYDKAMFSQAVSLSQDHSFGQVSTEYPSLRLFLVYEKTLIWTSAIAIPSPRQFSTWVLWLAHTLQ